MLRSSVVPRMSGFRHTATVRELDLCTWQFAGRLSPGCRLLLARA